MTMAVDHGIDDDDNDDYDSFHDSSPYLYLRSEYSEKKHIPNLD